MFLATVNWFQVPYNVAFADTDDSNIYVDIFNLSIDFFFMLDVIVNFRTSYVKESTNEEIFDLKKIALYYLKGRFWIDFLASVPFDLLTYAFNSSRSNQLTLQLIGLLKLIRVLRLSRLITYLNVKNELKMSLKLGKLIFFLILYIHCLGWTWFFIVKQNEEWIPPLDYVWIQTDIYDESQDEQYLNSIYHAVLMLGGNDIGPRGSFQIAFVVIMLLAGAIINANIFGNMAVILQSLNKKATNFQEKMDSVNETMKNLNIPMELREEIKSYFTFTQTTQDHQKELDEFLKMLSPSLRQKVITSIFHDVINQNKVFYKQNAMITSILQGIDVKLFLPEDVIIQQNEYAYNMYFLSRGEWIVSVITHKNNEAYVRTLHEGEYFGEVGLVKQCKRTATVMSKNYTIWANFGIESYTKLITEYPDIKESFEKIINEEYNDPWKSFMMKVLRNVDYLSKDIPNETLQEITYLLETITISEDSILFQPGDNWKHIHIICDGRLDLYVNNGNIDKYLDTLHVGSSIGAYSSLVNEPYWIKAISKTTCTLLKLPISKLSQLRDIHSSLDAKMSEYEDYIEANGLPYCDYRVFRSQHLKLRPIKKFQYGVRRIISILGSYKTFDFRELMVSVKQHIQKEKIIKVNKRESLLLKKHKLTEEQENNVMYIHLKSEMNVMKEYI